MASLSRTRRSQVTNYWPGFVDALSSLLLVIISFVFLAEFSGAPPDSTYTPAHIENGHLVPGIEKPGTAK